MNDSLSSNLVRVPLLIDQTTVRREVILAESTPKDDIFVARNIPAFVYGLALGDHFRLLDAERGYFELLKRSGEITLRAYIRGALDRQEVRDIIDALTHKGGQYEIARNSADASLLLLSASITLGFPAIESLLRKLPADICDWEYGNVHDRDGVPLNWWRELSLL